MYKTSGIHSDLMEIKSEIIKEKNTQELDKLRRENYKYKNIISDLVKLNRDILNEILSKHYTYCLPLTKVELKPYTNYEFERDFMQVVNIPLNNIIIRNFNYDLDKIYFEYREVTNGE